LGRDSERPHAYEDLSFLRKQDQRAYPNSLVVGLRRGLYLPAGLNAGHQIGLLIDRETLPYFGLPSFDALPIPFRSVATDLVSGKQFVFKDGSLAEALRATMSIPGAFTPVHDGQRVYVDGGLVNNLPHRCGSPDGCGHRNRRAPRNAAHRRKRYSVAAERVGAVRARGDFRKRNSWLGQRGCNRFRAARSFSDERFHQKRSHPAGRVRSRKQKSKLLAAFALDDSSWNEYVRERVTRKQPAAVVPQFIQVQGTSAPAQEDIRRYLKDFIGKPLNADKLDPALTQTNRKRALQHLGLPHCGTRRETRPADHRKRKRFAPPTLHPAFEVDGSEAGDIEFTLGTRLTLTDVAGFRSEWRTDFLFGNTYGVSSELYRPFRAESKWFVAPHASASDTTFQSMRRTIRELTIDFIARMSAPTSDTASADSAKFASAMT